MEGTTDSVCGTCGSIHAESFNRNMNSLGVLESKWDSIRKKLVRRLLEEQDKYYVMVARRSVHVQSYADNLTDREFFGSRKQHFVQCYFYFGVSKRDLIRHPASCCRNSRHVKIWTF